MVLKMKRDLNLKKKMARYILAIYTKIFPIQSKKQHGTQ